MKYIFCKRISPFILLWTFVLFGTSLHSQPYDVEWTSFINTSASGSTLTKIAGGSSWGNGGAISTNTIPANTDGWTEYTATAYINLMVGLSIPNNEANYNSIQYAAHINPGAYYVYENGNYVQNFGAYNLGDVFRVERIGTTVYYKRNGTIFHTSTIPSTAELITDASIYTQGHSVDNPKSSHPPSGGAASNSLFPYAQSFENGLDGWTEQVSSGIWLHNSGGTPSFGTGPTGAFHGNYYAYIEASSPNNPNKTAILSGPVYDLTDASFANFQFQYHIWGTNVGSLDVEISTNNGASWSSVWSKSGSQDNAWHRAEIDLTTYAGQMVQLRFNGQTGNGWSGDMAIDDLYLATAEYINPPPCTTTVSNFPYLESFESGTGNWEEKVSNNIWRRHTGSTGSGGTGPTSAFDGSYYFYTESSSPNYPNKTAVLESPCFDLSNESVAFLNFNHHMYGSYMGNLKLEISTDGGSNWALLWSKSGNQGNLWEGSSVDLSTYTGQTIRLRFYAVTGTSYTSDMSIDNLELTTTPPPGSTGCNTLISSFPYQESFESSFGNWNTPASPDIWQRRSGSTPSGSTGPSSAYDGSYYLFTEASYPRYPNKIDYIEGPCFDLSQAAIADLQFHYHMYGSGMGTLALEASTNNGVGWNQIWSMSGNQGNTWYPETIDLSAYVGGTIKLRFKGTTGANYWSDMAIDGLVLSAPTTANGNLAGQVSFPFTDTNCGTGYQMCCEDTPTSGTIPNVEITINDLENSTTETAVSDASGNFSKNIQGSTVSLSPAVEGSSWTNGLTTYDLLLLQQHINGTLLIDCPYRRLAGDADNDGDLDSDDYNLLQDLLLNVITTLPNAPNWKFIAKSYTNSGDLNPDTRFAADFWNVAAEDGNGLDYPFNGSLRANSTSYSYNGNDTWMEVLNATTFDPNPLCIGNNWGFYAVKTGDINGSASYTGFTPPSGGSRIANQSQDYLTETIIPIKSLNSSSEGRNRNNKYEVSFVLNSSQPILAYQMDIQFNDEVIELGKIKPNKDDLDQIEAKNFGQAIKTARGGNFKTIWMTNSKNENDGKVEFDEKDFSRGITLFSFEFKSKESLEVVRNAISLDNTQLETAFFGRRGPIKDVDLQVFIEARK